MVLSMDRWKSKVAVVTGASAGIGAALAKKLCEEGLNVVGIARRPEKVEELAKTLSPEDGKLYAVKADISKEQEVVDAFDWILKNVGPVSILINCAGVFFETNLVDGDANLWQQTFDINVIGLSICTREAVKQMRANNIDGQVIHIGSVPVYMIPNFPNFNVYTPSKQAVSSLTEMLRQELNQIQSKIKVSCINPGSVNTESYAAGYADIEAFNAIPKLETDDIASAVTYILSTPPHVQIHELTIKPIGELF